MSANLRKNRDRSIFREIECIDAINKSVPFFAELPDSSDLLIAAKFLNVKPVHDFFLEYPTEPLRYLNP